jgi:hypothetical protein
MRKLLKKQGFALETIVTDNLRSYGAAIRQLGLSARHEQTQRLNNWPRIRISRPGGEKVRCSDSNHQDQRSVFCPLMLPSTIPSTSNATSSHAKL